MEKFLPYLIILIFILIAVATYIVIKHFEKKRLNNKKVIKNDQKPRLKLKIPFLNKEEVRFLSAFQNALPSDYVAFPKVLLSDIVKPDGSMVIFNEIKNSQVDLCVFMKKNMQPVMVVDLISGDSFLAGLSEYIQKSLKSVNIPILSIHTANEYDKVDLLNQFLDKLDPIYMAQLRKN